MKKVVVTGGGGFIGHHLITFLKKKGYWVRGIDIKYPEYEPSKADDFLLADLRDYQSCVQAFSGVDHVYHLAADMGGIGYISGSHATIALNNTRMTINVIEAIRACGVSRVFFSSTACIYPLSLQRNPEVTSLREDMAHPAEPEEGYGWEKLYAEKLFQYLREDLKIETRVARFHNVYGPLGTYDGGREKAPAATCRKVARANDGDQIEVWGDGNQTRSFMYIDDCVEGVYRFMQSDFAGPLNIGTEELVTINELFDLASEIAGKKLSKKHDLSKPQGVRGRNSDNALIREKLNWEAKTPLKEGLAKTYHWIASQISAEYQTVNQSKSVVAVIGLGKLGSPMAACIADAGYAVIGADLDQNKVDAINNGFAPVEETGLAELIQQVRPKLKATTNIEGACSAVDLIFVIVPTPSAKNDMFSNSYLLSACEQIGAAIKNHSARPVVVVTSTVMPGSLQGPICQTLEQASGKKCGQGFGLCYSPEFIALGSVIHDLTHPDFYLIGESDAVSGEQLEKFYLSVCKNTPSVVRTNFVSAELAKLSLNSYVTMKISFANSLREFCERIPGAHVDSVTRAIGADARVGQKFLKGGTGFGGLCFPRDNKALIALANALGVRAHLAEATDRVNDNQLDQVQAIIHQRVPTGEGVAVLGLSYKPQTAVIEKSQAVELAARLVEDGYKVTVYDPAALDNVKAVLGNSVSYASSATECIKSCKASIIMTPWLQFAEITDVYIDAIKHGHLLIDCWRFFEKALTTKCDSGYIALGVGTKDSANAIANAELWSATPILSH